MQQPQAPGHLLLHLLALIGSPVLHGREAECGRKQKCYFWCNAAPAISVKSNVAAEAKTLAISTGNPRPFCARAGIGMDPQGQEECSNVRGTLCPGTCIGMQSSNPREHTACSNGVFGIERDSWRRAAPWMAAGWSARTVARSLLRFAQCAMCAMLYCVLCRVLGRESILECGRAKYGQWHCCSQRSAFSRDNAGDACAGRM
jgi:hypothetical protein